MLAAILLPKLLGGGGGSGQGVGQQSGDAADGMNHEIEQIVAGAAEDVQRYWETALPQSFQVDYPSVKTVLFEGNVSTACGPATSEVGPFYCPGDSLVYIDLEFMQQLEQRLVGTTADLAEQYIIAHEYGHHVQNVLGTNRRAQEAQQGGGADANQYSIALELQADCYAGLWVGDIAGRVSSSQATRSTRRSRPRRVSATTASREDRRAASTRSPGPTARPSSVRSGSRGASRPRTRAVRHVHGSRAS
jgi:predicted metalloprotease